MQLVFETYIVISIYLSHTLSFSHSLLRAKEVLRDLKSVEKSSDVSESYAMGFGLGFRVMGVKAGRIKLNTTLEYCSR